MISLRFRILLVITGLLAPFFALNSQNLPLLDINKTKFDFGVTEYMDTKIQKIVLKNIGDTTLTIYQVDSILKPFKGKIFYPDTLKKNDSLIYTLEYSPLRAGIDSQRVFLRADTRLSNSIALLIDVSLSMDKNMSDGVMKLTATNNAVSSFINSMLATPKVWDEAAIYSFAKNFYVNRDFTTDKTLLRNSLPKTMYNNTAFYDGCLESITRLKARKYVKVLVALTDGEDNSSRNTYTNVINQAKTANIRIYNIGIGSSTQDAILRTIANSTGGEFFKANSSKDLQDIYFRIFTLLSKNIELFFDLKGSCGSPGLTMDCTSEHYVNPGDTVDFPLSMTGVSSSGSQNNWFTLHLSFNPTLLFPLIPGSKMTDYGKFEIRGFCLGKLDTMPLIKLRFLSLLGNTDCTDIRIDSLKWDDTYYPTLKSDAECNLCIKSCVRNLRQVQLWNGNPEVSVTPNPASDYLEISFSTLSKRGSEISEDVKIYNYFGQLVLNNSQLSILSGSEAKVGETNSQSDNSSSQFTILKTHKYKIDISDLQPGVYFIRVGDKTKNFIKL